MKQYIYDGTKYVLHEDVVGLFELPTPSAKYLDKAFLLTADQTGYEKGAIYECHEVTPATDPKTYEWVKVTTSGDGMYKVYSGTHNSVDGEFYDADGNALPKVDRQRYYDVITRTTWIYYSAWSGFFRLFNDIVGMTSSQMLSPLIKEYYQELNATSFRCMNLSGNDGGLIEGFIYTLALDTVTPETGDDPSAKGWWYIDSTTHKYVLAEETAIVSDHLPYYEFNWTQVKPQQSIFPGTLDEWNALTPAEQAKYDFIATPDEAVEDIADAVIDGDMRAVTSNAVAQLHNVTYQMISDTELTKTATDYTTFLGRKLSDYDYFIVQQYDRSSLRNAAVINLNQFKIKNVILSSLHGANSSSPSDYSISGINVQYVDDTTVRAYATGSAIINILKIMGVKITT